MHNNIYLQLNKYKQLASTTIGSEQWRRWGAGQGRGRLVVGLLRGAVVGGVVAGLVRNGLAWRDLRAVLRWRGFRAAGWGRGGACTPWRGSCAAGWRRGGTCAPRWGGAVARFSRGGLALKSGLHAVLGRRRNSVTARLAHRDRVVAADLRVAKGGGGGHGLRVATWRRRGLARLEGWDMGVGIMWWRGGGVEDLACGVKRVSVTLVKKGRKKE